MSQLQSFCWNMLQKNMKMNKLQNSLWSSQQYPYDTSYEINQIPYQDSLAHLSVYSFDTSVNFNPGKLFIKK